MSNTTAFYHGSKATAEAVDQSPGDKLGSGKGIKITVHGSENYERSVVTIFLDEGGSRSLLESAISLAMAAADLHKVAKGEVL